MTVAVSVAVAKASALSRCDSAIVSPCAEVLGAALSENAQTLLASLSVADVIRQKRIRGGYPAEKPVELAEVLVRQSSRPGELVVDPFLGSGAFGVAAARLGRAFLGCDSNAEAVGIAARRLREAGARPEPRVYARARAVPD